MIWSLLNSKLEARGPLRFIGDVFEIGVAIGVLTAGTVAGGVVILPLLVAEYVSDARKAARCDAACAGKPVTKGGNP